MIARNRKIRISNIGDEIENNDLSYGLKDRARRVERALMLTLTAWAIREAKGDQVPKGLERVLNIIE